MATQIPEGSSPGSASATSPFPRSIDEPRTGAAPLDRMVQGAHDVVDRMAQRAQPAVDSLNSEWMTHCRSEVRAHPLSSVALGLLAGVLVGRLLSR